jgi:mRNA interferase YafQ
MRGIKYTSRYKRDYRREKSGVLGKKLDKLLMDAVNLLAADELLPQRYFDHALVGEWKDFRDCHLRPGSQTPTVWNWCALALIVSSASSESLNRKRSLSLPDARAFGALVIKKRRGRQAWNCGQGVTDRRLGVRRPWRRARQSRRCKGKARFR